MSASIPRAHALSLGVHRHAGHQLDGAAGLDLDREERVAWKRLPS